MSSPMLRDDLKFYQRLLASMGYYQAKIDGIWGPKTDAADVAFGEAARDLRDRFGELDVRSERNIMTLHIKAQEKAREFMKALVDGGFERSVKIIPGTRTYEEQNELYRKGRWGNPGPRVTNARAGASNHNFGIAWDIAIFGEDGAYYTGRNATERGWYDKAADVGRLDGVDWGGNWTSIQDRPHYELHTGLSTAEKRKRFEAGKLVV